MNAHAFGLTRPMIVDSFAGGGGASTGIEMALGRSPDVSINHSADALAMHEVNHPDTLHLDSNIWDVAPLEVTKGRRLGLFWASPDCKHFSKAKGGKPLDRNIRDLAWVVVRWAEEAKPDVIILENVEEFVTWGPLYEDGKPIVELRGQTFEDWTRRLKAAGYKVQHRELRACDYGAPTIRKRFFLIARRDGRPIVWPERTHGDPKKPVDAKLIAAGKLKPWCTAAEIIDWSLPCPSIFETSAEIMEKFGVRAVRPLADATMRRIARGVVRFVLDTPKPFVVRTDMASAAARNGVHSIDEPLNTLTTSGSFAAVVPSLATLNHGGGADHAPKPLDEPFRTLTASRDAHALVTPSIVGLAHGFSGGRREYGIDEPIGTVHAGGGNHVLLAPIVTSAQHGGAVRDVTDPIHTITASSKDQNAVIVPSLVGCGGRAGQSAPRGGDVPLGTLTAKADGCVVAATMVQTGYGEREGQAPRCLDIEAPIGTQVGGAAKHAVVSAFLAQHNTGVVGHALDKPLSTLTAGGAFGVSQQAVVAGHMMRQFGTSVGHDLDQPTHTDTATVNKSALIASFLTKYYGEALPNQAVDEPVHTVTTKPRHGLVTVELEGETYAIADIGMRMLTPRERFRAQGFPDSYIIDRRPDGSPLSATVQGSCCGNSVCPPLAAALVSANCAHLAAPAIVEAAE